MILGKRVLAIIPARGGSKGVPRKNIRMVAGKPLIAWTIDEAKKSRYIDSLILTSEDPEIIKVAHECGCEVPFIRPSELSLDETSGIEPVLHAIESLPGYDYVVLLQPTSPLRISDDIDTCLDMCINNGVTSAVSLTEPDKHPFWMYYRAENGQITSVLDPVRNFDRRQDLPHVYALNGAVYVAECKWLMENRTFVSPETLGYVMAKERSLDIDTEMDLTLANFILSGGFLK